MEPRDLLVELLRQDVDLAALVPALLGEQSAICASTWFVNELLITKLGWPVAQPRFTSRPRARTMIRLPSGKMK